MWLRITPWFSCPTCKLSHPLRRPALTPECSKGCRLHSDALWSIRRQSCSDSELCQWKTQLPSPSDPLESTWAVRFSTTCSLRIRRWKGPNGPSGSSKTWKTQSFELERNGKNCTQVTFGAGSSSSISCSFLCTSGKLIVFWAFLINSHPGSRTQHRRFRIEWLWCFR